MWLWEKLVAWIISVSMFGWSPECPDENNSTNQWQSEKIENIVEKKESIIISDFPEIQKWTKKEISICLTPDSQNSFTHTNAIEQVSDPRNTILEYPLEQLFQKYGNNAHPLRVSWVGRDFGALLWKNWIERLTKQTPQKLSSRSEEITSSTRYEIGDTLRFPLIDPLLKDDFPQYLSDQLKEEWFTNFSDPDSSVISQRITSKVNQNNDNEKSDFIYDIVLKRVPSWKAALALYRDWELFMATYASIWLKTRKTKMWQFKILGKDPYKRSRKYDNAPMPMALHFGDGFAFHQWRVTWYDLSHGCGRLPGVYAVVLYSSVKDHIETVNIFISKDLYKQ